MFRRSAALVAVAASIATGFTTAGLLAAPAVAASPPSQLVSMTLSAASVDVTTGAKTVTITVRATDSVKLRAVDGWAELAPTTGPGGGDMEWYAAPTFQLASVSGTDTDGTFRGPLTLPAGADGVYGITLSLYGGVSEVTRLSPADLAAAGQPSGVRAVTTAVPAKLATLKGTTSLVLPGRPWDSPLWITSSVLSWTFGTGGGAVRSVQVVSKSSNCGDVPPFYQPGRTGPYLDPSRVPARLTGRGIGVCTITLRAVNGAGGGSGTTISFL